MAIRGKRILIADILAFSHGNEGQNNVFGKLCKIPL